ncbi:hypothetical protein AGABI2DRAFT_118309 [Agaricus bisporus var. bisporus H97]|uniref:hypothetical protein n=1 Tax=Agaricus bisporus var. bisporus (strain H97 / ATCC MYA-4626 / FGSC 10389) TaxID=936046 RepID=UPI00029F75B6|nr:hypothetical protein AGABI2DRAFT_118309 [Agaricus bisporus var. bisporus H97]EKV47761.1 hypothetical protein AGABI2DRAFT_118309 [Agaricus bisporus var. bisporus H97]
MEATSAAPRRWETVTVEHQSSFASLTSDSSAEPTSHPCPSLQQNDPSQRYTNKYFGRLLVEMYIQYSSSDFSEPEAALGADSDTVAPNPRDKFERRQESAEGGSSRPAFGNHGWGSWGPWGGNTNFNPGQTNLPSVVVTSSATTTIFQTVAESQTPPTSTLTTNVDSANSRGANLKLILPLSIIIPLIAIAILVFLILRWRNRKRVQTSSNRRSVHHSITPYNKILLEQSYIDGVGGADGGGGRGEGEGNDIPSERSTGLGRRLEREITSAMRQLESLRDLTTQYHRRSGELSQVQVSPVLHPHSRRASSNSTPPPSYLPERDSIV